MSPKDWDKLRAVAQCFWHHPGVSTSHLVYAAIQSYVREACARAGLAEADLTAMSPAQRKEFGDRWRKEADAAFMAGRRAYARVDRAVITLDPRERAALEYFLNLWFPKSSVGIDYALVSVLRVALSNPAALNAQEQASARYCRSEGIENWQEFLLASLAKRKEYRRAAARLRKRVEAP